MKHQRIFLALTVLMLTSLACQALSGGGSGGGGNTSDSGFPMTDDAYNVTEAGDTLLFYTKLSLEDVMKFYREEYTSKGYKERELLTVVSATTFSMVFDGDPSGKAIVIQSVDLGNGRHTVAIRLEDV